MRSRTSVAVAAAVATALGALSLLPTYAGLRWLPATWGAILVVAVVAQGARLIGVPAWLSPGLALAGLASYVTAVYAHASAYLGFLPGAAARSVLADLTRQGWHDVSALRAPVPTGQGLVLLTVCGVGVVAIVVDLIAVVMRRPALAGLPLLALFAVSAATVPHGVGWLPFVYGGVGYLALLLTESADRISRWGHPLGSGNSRSESTAPAVRAERAQTAPLFQVGRRVGVAAIVVAVVVPAVVPGLHAGLFGTGGGHGAGFGSGNSTVTTYNPILRIRDQLAKQQQLTLLRYGTNDPEPSYLRMTALDRFDGSGWTQGDLTAPASHQVTKGLPQPFGLEAAIRTIDVQSNVKATGGLQIPWLPVPYPSVQVNVDKGDWRYDDVSGAIFSTQTTTRGRNWGSTSRRLQPTKAQLAKATTVHPAALDRYVGVDRSVVPKLLVTTAQSVTQDARTPFDQAVALQDYFHGAHFHYTTDAPQGANANVIEQFLKDGRGFCVQFASTMALMARSLGIPARVAIGFTRGAQQADGSYLITTLDAHAWPELYFNGIGWLNFEPTPRGDGQAVTPSYTQATPTGPTPGTSPAPGDVTPTPTASPNGTLIPPSLRHALDEPATATFPHAHHRDPWSAVLLALAVLLVLASAPAAGRWLTRRRRWAAAETGAARAHAAWRELADDARDLGFQWRGSDSPRRAMSRLVTASGLTRTTEQLGRLVSSEEQSRYAQTIAEIDGLTADGRAVRRELADLAGRRRRWAAVLLPRSTVATTASFAANRIADTLDLFDVAVAFVYRIVVPRRLRRS